MKRCVVALTWSLVICVIASGCSGNDAMVDEPSQASLLIPSESINPEPLKEDNPLLSDEYPDLTPEELSKVNQIIPEEMWGYMSSDDIEKAGIVNHFEEIFQKDISQITYGEVWRFDNGGERYKSYIKLTPILAEMKSIKAIELSYLLPAKLSEWEYIARMSWLEVLYISSMSIDGFFEAMDTSPLISEISLWYVIETTLPDEFDKFPNLEYLSINSNLKELPNSIFGLENLLFLDISRNRCTELSAQIGKLQKLEELRIASPFVVIPDEVCSLQNLKKLSLGITYSTYYGIDEELAEMMENAAKTLPDNIGDLTLLEALNIDNMPIVTLPDSIGNLINLNQLMIIDETESLQSLPDSFANLTNLRIINLPTPELTALAKEMVGLS